MVRTKTPSKHWRSRLYAKTHEIQAWDCKWKPRPFISALCRPFGIRPHFSTLNPEYPEVFLKVLARKHGLQAYELPSLVGSDAYGFILSKETLNRREIQQLDDDFHEPARALSWMRKNGYPDVISDEEFERVMQPFKDKLDRDGARFVKIAARTLKKDPEE
jgi:hypothetical protein